MKIDGVTVYTPDIFTDFRGDICTLWKQDDPIYPKLKFNHDKICTSKKGVLRGLHGDSKSYKLVTCLYGELYFVIADYRPTSATYLQWDYMILNDKTRKQVLLPPGVVNGFIALSEDSVFHYKWSYAGDYPDVDHQITVKWNDPAFNIKWPVKHELISFRDM